VSLLLRKELDNMLTKISQKWQILDRKIQYTLYLVIIALLYTISILAINSQNLRFILPFLLLFFSGFPLTHLFFKNESVIDKIIIGYGFSILFNIIIFHFLMHIQDYSQNNLFNYHFLIISLVISIIPMFLSYFQKNNHNKVDDEIITIQRPFFEQLSIIFVGAMMLLIMFIQVCFINIPNHALDEYSYIYIARNLMVDNTNFTATPPWINKLRYVPRYVFITQISVFCSFFGFQLESAELVIIASNIMLIPVVFSTASTVFNRKVGVVATALIVVNPVYWLLSIRIYPDIPVTVLSWASFYFLLKAVKMGKNCLKQKFAILSGLFLMLALFTKYTVILLMPAFFLAYIIYTRKYWENNSNNRSVFSLMLVILCLSVILAIIRFWSDIIDYIVNFSSMIEQWKFGPIYDTMINPLGPISQFSVLILFGIFFSIKSEEGKRNFPIFVAAWVGYMPFFLFVPHFIPDQRHIFSQQVSLVILVAFGVISISQHRKIWKIALPIVILAHAIDESFAWKGTRQSSILIEVLLFITLLVFLVYGVKKTAGSSTINKHAIQAIILLTITIITFTNSQFLNKYNWTWDEQIRDESRVQANYYLENVGKWLISHQTENKLVMTNAYATLPYYARFIIVYVPPETEEEFLSNLRQKSVGYLIIFWGNEPFLRHVLGGITIPDEVSYLQEYVRNPLPNAKQVYSDNTKTIDDNEIGVVIFEIQR